MDIIERRIENEIKKALKSSKITEILGARQIGKTTFLKNFAKKKNAAYVSFDDALTRNFALRDPKEFLKQSDKKLLVIDEVQKVPSIISELKLKVDNSDAYGKILITGSSDLSNLKGIHESLAGRASIIEMHGFSQDEISNSKSNFLKHILSGKIKTDFTSDLSKDGYQKIMARGGYPEVILNKKVKEDVWYKNYLRLIFNRDAKDISDLRRTSDLPKIIRYIAATLGKELVLSNMANGIAIPRTTLDPYVSLLETLFLVRRIDPWHNNLVSRVVKNKKAFITDTGLANYLMRGKIDVGGLFETFVFDEIRKQISYNLNPEVNIFHFRDYEGKEVDLILETADEKIIAIETKFSSTPSYSDIKTIKELKRKYKKKMLYGIVFYTGNETLSVGDGIYFAPASMIWQDE